MIGDVIIDIKKALPDGVELVAVSKYQPIEKLEAAYEAGQRIFGESHVQELEQKHAQLPKDIKWHFIGHLQTNKVKYIAPYIDLIHAVDTPKLLTEISRQGIKNDRSIPCLLQLHVAQEETKYGFTPEECWQYLEDGEWKNMTGADIQGIMCMASNTEDEEQIKEEFDKAHHFMMKVKDTFFNDKSSFKQCSMGMSGDFPIAINCGSTMIRVGSMIFGAR